MINNTIRHRNSQKRFYGENKTYFITTITQDRFPYFKEELFCQLFVENLRLCKKLKKFLLSGFVILHEHVHLMIKPVGRFNVSEIMQNLKRTTSLQINQVMGMYGGWPLVEEGEEIEGENIYSRLQSRPNKKTFSRLQENHNNEIIRHQELVVQYHQRFIQKYGSPQYRIPSFQWKKSFHDHIIRDRRDFIKHRNYLITNPRKHGIYGDSARRWSSLNPEFKDLVDKNFFLISSPYIIS